VKTIKYIKIYNIASIIANTIKSRMTSRLRRTYTNVMLRVFDIRTWGQLCGNLTLTLPPVYQNMLICPYYLIILIMFKI